MSDDEEAREVAAAARGDQEAMRRLYEAHVDSVFRYARARIGDASEAADIAHEVMLEFWRRPERFEGRSSLRGYLLSVARHKSIDRLRDRARRPLSEADPEIPDSDPDPEAVLAALQDAARVRRCLDRLSPAHRAVLQLAFFENLSYERIAEIEGAPIGTIKTRAMHAKKRMMQLLAEDGREKP